MELILNGFPEEITDNITVQELLDTMQEDDPAVIVEVNGRFIHRKDFKTHSLHNGDTVELIHPSFGG